jgi:glycosyltransferase involved in cell wall biosynthesis
MITPNVTILMPVYNAEAYIQVALDSILGQTYTNFEVLIINDGSTDGTQEVINAYTDKRIRCIQQENCGVAQSLNNGIDLVNTKYIRRHDADDYSEPDMLATQMEFLQNNSDIDFVSTRCAFMTDRGKVAKEYTSPDIFYFDKNKDFIIAERSLFKPYSPIVHGTVLGLTSVFKEMGGYRTAFLTSEDSDLWLRIIEKHKFAILKHPYYHLRLNATSATQRHKSSVVFYRNVCHRFADERMAIGSDPLLRGEPMPIPQKEDLELPQKYVKSKTFRADILDYNYLVHLNARDYNNILKDIYYALQDGWRLKQTYKAIIIPILGSKFMAMGSKLKQILFRNH